MLDSGLFKPPNTIGGPVTLVRPQPIERGLMSTQAPVTDDSPHNKAFDDLTTRDVGILGENLACQFLEARDIEILERNWKCKFGEVDLIAREGSEIAFIEVKTRKATSEPPVPELAVTAKKCERYKKLIAAYTATHIVEESRFDVVGITLKSNSVAHIHYIKGIPLGDEQ